MKVKYPAGFSEECEWKIVMNLKKSEFRYVRRNDVISPTRSFSRKLSEKS